MTWNDDPDDEVVSESMPVHVRRVEYGEGDRAEQSAVHCPLRHRMVELEECESCPRKLELRTEAGARVLRCDIRTRVEQRKREDEPEDLVEAMAHTRVSDVMAPGVTCLDSQLSLSEAAGVLEAAGLHAAPVVEDDVLVGVLSVTNVIQGHGRNRPPSGADDSVFGDYSHRLGLLVEDVMTSEVISLWESTSLAEALKILARDRTHRAPVVSSEGKVVGMLSMSDVLRWIAQRLD